MRRPVSGRDAIRSQVIDALEAPTDKETGNEKSNALAATSKRKFDQKMIIGLDLAPNR